MKQPKKLTRNQKERLRAEGLNEKEFMLLSEDNNSFTVIAKQVNRFGQRRQITFEK